MGVLGDFRQKDMIEQITYLDMVSESKRLEAIPELFELYTAPVGDQAVDEMVYHALYGLLRGETARIVEGLGHNSRALRLLCIRRAAEDGGEALKAPLVAMLDSTDDAELVGEILRALAVFNDSSLRGVFLSFFGHEDDVVAAWAMRGAVACDDPVVRDALISLIDASVEMRGDGSGGCSLRVATAVDNLARFTDDQAIAYFARHIHHPNPSLRSIMNYAFAAMGEAVLPSLGEILRTGDKDEKIMAANILGLTALKEAAEILVEGLEGQEDLNLKFAIYEALGRVNSLRSVVGLADGLVEQDEMVLIAVITSLDNLCNPGVLKVVAQALDKADAQAGRVAAAIVASRARELFTALYVAGRHADMLLAAVKGSNDREAVEVFRQALAAIDTEPARAAAAGLAGQTSAGSGGDKRLLAADDSKAMLFFYKGVAADLGMELVTVEDGKQAYEYLQNDGDFDLIITDMNMPNMDGIELTRKLRALEAFAGKPILMATTESESSQSALAAQAGVTDFISKPFTKEGLREKIEQLFG